MFDNVSALMRTGRVHSRQFIDAFRLADPATQRHYMHIATLRHPTNPQSQFGDLPPEILSSAMRHFTNFHAEYRARLNRRHREESALTRFLETLGNDLERNEGEDYDRRHPPQ